jgi:hypothetical protein
MFAMDTCAAVRRFVFVEGKSLHEAARVFGLSRDTIAKMCRYSTPLGYVRSKPPERPKLGPLAPVIDAVLEADKTAPATDGEADFRTAADRTWLRWRLHPSPYRKTRSDWHIAGNRAMLRPMGDMLKTDLVGRRRPVPIKGLARSGDPDAAPSAQCAAKKSAEAARPQQFRSSGFCRLQLDCAARCECLGDRRAGDGYPVASCRFSFVLAMEVAMPRRQTRCRSKFANCSAPRVGRSPDPWRNPQARH